MDDRVREKHKKVIAEYRNSVDNWQLKPTIEERLAAWREAQEMQPRAQEAEQCLIADELLKRESPTEEQCIQDVKNQCEYLGINSSELLKNFKKNAL